MRAKSWQSLDNIRCGTQLRQGYARSTPSDDRPSVSCKETPDFHSEARNGEGEAGMTRPERSDGCPLIDACHATAETCGQAIRSEARGHWARELKDRFWLSLRLATGQAQRCIIQRSRDDLEGQNRPKNRTAGQFCPMFQASGSPSRLPSRQSGICRVRVFGQPLPGSCQNPCEFRTLHPAA